jgi:hypothetical protein
MGIVVLIQVEIDTKQINSLGYDAVADAAAAVKEGIGRHCEPLVFHEQLRCAGKDIKQTAVLHPDPVFPGAVRDSGCDADEGV